MGDIKHIGIVGCGSMGTEMSLLFAEKGLHSFIFDVIGENVDKAIERAKKDKLDEHYTGCKDYEKFMQCFPKGELRVILLSITHGKPVDEVLDSLIPLLKKHPEETILIDGGNEWYLDSEKRQKRIHEEFGDQVKYIGTGVSGGYQSARRGPSMSPSGDKSAYERVEGLLTKFAAHSDVGGPCVTYIGPGGSGHYVKMVHNGIEQGMLSITSEVYAILKTTLGLPNDRIGKIFDDWVAHGELKGNFLFKICGEICQRKNEKGDGFVIDDIEDKVTQDIDDSEGTGFWTVMEAALQHVPCPTIAEAHFLRIASADRPIRRAFAQGVNVTKPQASKDQKAEEWIETLRLASYGGFLACFAQGCNLIAKMSRKQKWHIKMSEVMRIYRAGCIIQSDYIIGFLQPLFAEAEKSDDEPVNILSKKVFHEEVNKTIKALKQTILLGVETDAIIPAFASAWEYIKYSANEELPTHLEEAQLDYFGAHRFTSRSDTNEERDKIAKGKQHIVWKNPY